MTGFVQRFEGFEAVSLHYNALDERGKGMDGIYLSLTGTSAEDADSGQVGRGNRVNGVISVSRPLGTEAAAGKNPISHVGKIYNVLSHRIAEILFNEIVGMREVTVYLVSRIGTPIDRPRLAAVQIAPQFGMDVRDIARQVEEIVARELSGIGKFCKDLSEGRYPVC
jgi:S-adenosylmethionine synthetase